MNLKILEKYLRKKGITNPEELDTDERKTFDEWKSVLSKEELTMDDLKQFIHGQIEVIENHWKDLTIENAKKAELIPYHTTYKTLLMAINAPAHMREALEQQLNQLINQ